MCAFPRRRFLLLNEAGYIQPVIVQEALDERLLMRPRIEAADLPEALSILEAAASSIADFWGRVAQRPERIGYHPSIRNFAIDEDGPIFFDTFPPLIGYSREEMGRLLLRFSESGLVRGMGRVMPERIRGIQDEWLSHHAGAPSWGPPVGSAGAVASRTGPGILDWAGNFTRRRHLQARLARRSAGRKLDRPPRLPAFLDGHAPLCWGPQRGKPNVWTAPAGAEAAMKGTSLSAPEIPGQPPAQSGGPASR